jgi:fructokinase
MPHSPAPVYGGIEAGGTKFVCAVGTGPNDIRAIERFPTTTPEETFANVIRFFESGPAPVAALGIGSFGPVDPNPGSPTFGYITSTPKRGWAHVDFVGAMRKALGVPVAFDTDVNVAALGEHAWGAAQGLDTFLYLTVGTGIGGGGLVGGKPMHGLIHPEMGHLLLPRLPGDDFDGVCPYHGTCLEGMANGPALEARWGIRAENLPPDHPAWDVEAHYLAHAVVNYVYVLSPQRVILGGGVMKQQQLFPLIRHRVQELLNGYVQSPAILDQIDSYIVPPALGDRAGVLGALALAHRAVVNASS